MSLEQYKDASRKELWDILQIQMQVLQAETARVAELEAKIEDYANTYFTCKCKPSEMKAHNLEQRIAGMVEVVTQRCPVSGFVVYEEQSREQILDYVEHLRNQAKALKEQVNEY
jgi:hypothetical protein